MALSGYVTAEQRKCRQVATKKGLVVAYRYAPQDYEIFRNGVVLGRVTKFKHWYPTIQPPHATLGDGSRWPQKTRQAAIEWVVKHYRRQPSNEPHEGRPAA
jgi:hypothetical protein